MWLQNPNSKLLKFVVTCGPREKKRKGHSKLDEQIRHGLYTWITRHTQIFQSPISNDCIKVMLDDQTESQLVPKLLLQVSVIELHIAL